MSAAEILDHLRQSGVRVERHGNRLRLTARTPPPEELLLRLRAAKPDVLAALPDADAPPARVVVKYVFSGQSTNSWNVAIGPGPRERVVADVLSRWPEARVLP